VAIRLLQLQKPLNQKETKTIMILTTFLVILTKEESIAALKSIKMIVICMKGNLITLSIQNRTLLILLLKKILD